MSKCYTAPRHDAMQRNKDANNNHIEEYKLPNKKNKNRTLVSAIATYLDKTIDTG